MQTEIFIDEIISGICFRITGVGGICRGTDETGLIITYFGKCWPFFIIKKFFKPQKLKWIKILPGFFFSSTIWWRYLHSRGEECFLRSRVAEWWQYWWRGRFPWLRSCGRKGQLSHPCFTRKVKSKTGNVYMHQLVPKETEITSTFSRALIMEVVLWKAFGILFVFWMFPIHKCHNSRLLFGPSDRRVNQATRKDTI